MHQTKAVVVFVKWNACGDHASMCRQEDIEALVIELGRMAERHSRELS